MNILWNRREALGHLDGTVYSRRLLTEALFLRIDPVQITNPFSLSIYKFQATKYSNKIFDLNFRSLIIAQIPADISSSAQHVMTRLPPCQKIGLH